jgi:hypothetical protein
MADFAASVVRFLEFNEYRILEDKGKISRKQADEKAISEYAVFNKRQAIESDFDRITKKLEKKIEQSTKKLPKEGGNNE